jgi:uncharacterized membrane protein YvlD (DUF360 family)
LHLFILLVGYYTTEWRDDAGLELTFLEFPLFAILTAASSLELTQNLMFDNSSMVFYSVAGSIVYGFIGAVTGLIIDKIKNNLNKKPSPYI